MQLTILVVSLVLALIPYKMVRADQLFWASVEFSEAERQSSKPAKSVVKPKPQWYELQGSLNREYVYLIVKKTGQRQIEGYLFDSHGNKKFVFGEWFNKQLQIYDRSNKRLTVILYE
ncbi:MAG: hypothetical protein ACU83N_05555 [Gammaproteobacteria bacterium]